MTRDERHEVNQAAARRLKPTIDADYPPKQFVAISGGRIVADDPDLFRLMEKLDALGIERWEPVVERAGDDTPDYIDIL